MNKKVISILTGLIILVVACQSVKTISSEPTIITSEISYEHSISPIMNNYCITCHSETKPASGFSLTSYEDVRFQTEKGALLERINDNQYPMPMSGLMAKKNRQIIKQWAENGFLEKSIDKTNVEISKNDFNPTIIKPIDINIKGFEFFNLMQGHWVGKMNIMGQKYNWFSFDYRPISSSHIHGIYEGGTIGNLFTSFFITNFNDEKTIMARNGGILNGIYRTSYFVLDKVEITNERKYFRFVDAYGGKDIMWMELEFRGDNLKFNSYTSRFGLNGPPKQHMKFEAIKKHIGVANKVAKALNYPQNSIEKDFSNGLPLPDWGDKYPVVTSASYIHNDTAIDLVSLGKLAGDPFGIDEIPYISSLKVWIEQREQIKDQDLIIYLSKESLTKENGDFIMEYGFIKQSLFDGIFLFPDIAANQQEFTFEYLHPGDYYVTIVSDLNKDGFASKGDITSKSTAISVKPNAKQEIEIKGITNKN